MKTKLVSTMLFCLCFSFFGCSREEGTMIKSGEEDFEQNNQSISGFYTTETKISDVINDEAFESYGRLIFPVDSGYYSGDTLGELQLTWYNNIDPNKTVEIVNYLKSHAEAGDIVFYDIYTEEEKREDPEKEDTGLFFFKGNPGEKFAVCNAGGGFAYVGAMQDSFPHALELSKKGYNAFALIYRPGAIIMQYTGHSSYTENDPPTYACVGENDGIANWHTMESRLEKLDELGIPTEFHHYPGLRHGFGLGTGTVAEG